MIWPQEVNVWGGKAGKHETSGKGSKHNASGKSGERYTRRKDGKGRSKGGVGSGSRGDTGGKGNAYFIATNREITVAARTAAEFEAVLWKLWREKRPLNGVNVSTILHRSAKLWHCIHPRILTYLANSVSASDVSISLRAQAVGKRMDPLPRRVFSGPAQGSGCRC